MTRGFRGSDQENRSHGFMMGRGSFPGKNPAQKEILAYHLKTFGWGSCPWSHRRKSSGISSKCPRLSNVKFAVKISLSCQSRLLWPWKASAAQLTAWSSRSSKILERTRRRSGTVMMRTKGNAREATVDFTTHRATMHNSWMMVNKFIRHVFTWSGTRVVG